MPLACYSVVVFLLPDWLYLPRLQNSIQPSICPWMVEEEVDNRLFQVIMNSLNVCENRHLWKRMCISLLQMKVHFYINNVCINISIDLYEFFLFDFFFFRVIISWVSWKQYIASILQLGHFDIWHFARKLAGKMMAGFNMQLLYI